MKENILGFNVDVTEVTSCCLEIVKSIHSNTKCWLACYNPHSYVVSKKDEKFTAALKSADWLIADGYGIVMASRFLNKKIKNRVTGYDIFDGVHRSIQELKNIRVFFLGSTDSTLEVIKQKIKVDYPWIDAVETYSPPFKNEFNYQDTSKIISKINSFNADILWVGMTAPKQEKWIYDNFHSLNVRFVGAVGAVFDFYAGTVRRAPLWMQNNGLEWLHRSIVNPSRLGQRNMRSNPIFLADLFIDKIKGT